MSYIDELLSKAKKKSDAAEVFFMKSETTSCDWSSDKLKLATTKETSGVAVRVLKDGKLGFFASNKLDDPDKIAGMACELAPLGSEFSGTLPEKYIPGSDDFYHEATANTGADKLIKTGNEMIEIARKSRDDALFDAKLECSIIEVTIANTRGAQHSFKKTIFSGYISGSVTREGDVLGIYEFDEASYIDGQPYDWAEIVAKKLVDAATIVPLPPGDYPAILLPKAMAMFGPIRSALNARAVLKDLSPFAGKEGEKIFDGRIHIIDDGIHQTTPGSQPVDDEGVTSQKTSLIEAGILMGYIHDLHTAAKMGVAPTGNGMRAGLSSTPKAGYTTLTIMPGRKKLSDMIAGMSRGVIIDQVMGAHQASPFSGDFSVSVDLGFLVEKGRIVGRFKDSMLAGNAFRMFKDQVVEIGSEPKFTGFYSPPILFDGMTLATGG